MEKFSILNLIKSFTDNREEPESTTTTDKKTQERTGGEHTDEKDVYSAFIRTHEARKNDILGKKTR